MLELNKIYQGDCLEVMKQIEDKSVDMILCDLPYGTTSCRWDTIIPFEPLWEQYKRIIKDNGAIVLTASQPFTSALVISNPNMFRYEWIWAKNKGSNPLLANKQPMKAHENILVFYIKSPIYNPQFRNGTPYKGRKTANKKSNILGIENGDGFIQKDSNGKLYPLSHITFSREIRNQDSLHPTQKPVALFEYLIKTYTNEGNLVLDNCIGSGTTAVACIKTNRRFIGIEKEAEYVKIAEARIDSYLEQTKINEQPKDI